MFAKLLDWVGRVQIVQGFAQFAWTLWPAGTAALTGLIGVLTGQPSMWILAVGFAVMSFGAVFILAYSIQRERKNPLNKLKIGNVIFPHDLAPLVMPNRQIRQGMGKKDIVVTPLPRKINMGQLGVELINTAGFPISIICENADTEISGFRPPRGKYPKKPTMLQAGGSVWMHDDAIDLKGIICGVLRGKIDMKIKYGYKGNENLELIHKGTVEIFFEPSGAVKQLYFHPEDLLENT